MSSNFQYFLAVAEEHSFTRAAENLYISQSALTKYIKRLEESLGIILFERTTPVRLTYAGEVYLQYAKQSIRQEKELFQNFQEIAQDERGKLRLGISTFRGSVLLPEVLPVYQRRFPKVEIELVERQSRDLVTDLLNDRVDFCISNPTDIIDLTQLSYESLYSEKLFLAVDLSFPALRRYLPDPEWVRQENARQHYPIFDIKAVLDEPFLMLQPQQSMAYIVENFLRRQNIYLRRTLRTTSLSTAINLAAVGLGFCFVPDILHRKDKFPQSLLYFRISETDIIWEHAAFYRKDELLSSHSRAFIDTVKGLYRPQV